MLSVTSIISKNAESFSETLQFPLFFQRLEISLSNRKPSPKATKIFVSIYNIGSFL